MNPDLTNNPLLQSVDFGFEVQAFLASNVGRYLSRRAETDVEDALEAMKSVNAENPTAIRNLQHKIQVAESVLYWLGEAVQAGRNAEAEIHEQST